MLHRARSTETAPKYIPPPLIYRAVAALQATVRASLTTATVGTSDFSILVRARTQAAQYAASFPNPSSEPTSRPRAHAPAQARVSRKPRQSPQPMTERSEITGQATEGPSSMRDWTRTRLGRRPTVYTGNPLLGTTDLDGVHTSTPPVAAWAHEACGAGGIRGVRRLSATGVLRGQPAKGLFADTSGSSSRTGRRASNQPKPTRAASSTATPRRASAAWASVH